MPTVKELKQEYQDLALKAHEIVASDRTPTEIREALDKIEGAADKPEPGTLKYLSAQIADAEYLEEKRKAYAPAVNGSEAPAEQPTPDSIESIGVQLVKSPEFAAARADLAKGGTFRQTAELKLIKNATLTQSGLGSANVIAQDRRPGILPILFERLTIADLMPNGTTNSNTVRYVKESTATNAASTVAEEGLKPEAALNFTVVDEPVRKIGVTLKSTDEMLEDIDQLESYINGRLALFVQLREEQQLLTGNASVSSQDITGILNRSGLTAAQALGGDTRAVAAHKEITKIRVASFLDPTGIVFHPNDWEATRLEQDANDQFYGGGPFTGPYGVNGIAGDTYWGLPVVSTTAMTENTVLIGAFATAAQIFRRNSLTVEMTNSNEDDFKYNRVAFRAEERLALAVYRPAAFGTVTGV